jgi:hypothetical protein
MGFQAVSIFELPIGCMVSLISVFFFEVGEFAAEGYCYYIRKVTCRVASIDI